MKKSLMKAKKTAPPMLAHREGARGSVGVDDTLSDSHSTHSDTGCQTLSDKLSEVCEMRDRFAPKHTGSLLLSEVFGILADMDKEKSILYSRKVERVARCGEFLEFAHEVDSDGVIDQKGKLFRALFCRERLCPMCAWRRSLKIFGQVSQIMDVIADDYAFLMLTLTVPNVSGELLEVTIKRLMKSWTRLTHHKAFQRAVRGYFRALEVTRNSSTGDFHPHFHIVLAVDHSYFKTKDYISRDAWLAMWRKAYKDDSILMVDIRRVNGKGKDGQDELKSAVAEVAKYTVKDKDYILPDNTMASCYVVDTLSRALHGVRLCHFGGVFKDTYRLLQLQDAESDDADLVDVGQDKIRNDVALLIIRYGWGVGAYKSEDRWIISPDDNRKMKSA